MYNHEHPTIELIESYVRNFPKENRLAFCYGPAHIVIDDYALSDNNIHFCMNRTKEWLQDTTTISSTYSAFKDMSVGECITILGETYKLLELLLAIPEEEREVYE